MQKYQGRVSLMFSILINALVFAVLALISPVNTLRLLRLTPVHMLILFYLSNALTAIGAP
jgi:hypothetical protein